MKLDLVKKIARNKLEKGVPEKEVDKWLEEREDLFPEIGMAIHSFRRVLLHLKPITQINLERNDRRDRRRQELILKREEKRSREKLEQEKYGKFTFTSVRIPVGIKRWLFEKDKAYTKLIREILIDKYEEEQREKEVSDGDIVSSV